MANPIALSLFQSGRSHALSSDLLYRAALSDGEERGLNDPEHFAFNGTFSLSIHYLLGLGLELMLKAVIVELDGEADERTLRAIGHDLVAAFERTQALGFESTASRLEDLIHLLNEPFKAHWFRYERPENFPLPGDFAQVVETLERLDSELQEIFWS